MILQIRVSMFSSWWKLSKLIDQIENLINHIEYTFLWKIGIFWILLIFAKMLKFPGDRLELLPSVYRLRGDVLQPPQQLLWSLNNLKWGSFGNSEPTKFENSRLVWAFMRDTLENATSLTSPSTGHRFLWLEDLNQIFIWTHCLSMIGRDITLASASN